MRTKLFRLAAILLALLATRALAQPTTAPATTRPTKQLYYNVSWFLPSWRAQLPPGYLPALTEGGGRYTNAQGKEDSYFVGGYHGPKQEIVAAKLRYAVASLPPGTLYVYDQESPTWSTDIRTNPPEVAERNKQRFRAFAATIHEANPLVRVAFYDMLPRFEYWNLLRQYDAHVLHGKVEAGKPLGDGDAWSLSHAYKWDGKAWRLDDSIEGPEGRATFLKWQAAGDYDRFTLRPDGTRDDAAGLDDAVDAITPSLYDFYVGDDTAGPTALTIAEARRLAGGRPVYPFVWPCYHESNPDVGGKTIPLDEWRAHVARVLRQADGVVLWGADPVRHREHIRVLQEEAEKASRGID